MLGSASVRFGSRLARAARGNVQLNVRWLATAQENLLKPSDSLIDRHIGPSESEIQEMLAVLGYKSLDEFMAETVPDTIKNNRTLGVGEPLSESQALLRLQKIAQKNKVLRSYIGMGYYDTITPATILRNVLENPAWYTSYTPYQAEVSQGRMESLLNYQTMVKDMTGMEIANASLLDEATAGAEAMSMCLSLNPKAKCFFVSDSCHPQTLAVIQQRAIPLGVEIVVGDHRDYDFDSRDLCGAIVQYPATDGRIDDMSEVAAKIKANNKGKCKLVVASDLLALSKLQPPGEFGADIALGSAQRFGVPMGYGGPHAAFFAVSGGSSVIRKMPGRIMGVSTDADGQKGIRLTLQTREQHIRRDKATSNVCTAQALLANIAAMYAIYHGPEGIKRIADRAHACAATTRAGLQQLGYQVDDGAIFDTIRVRTDKASELCAKAVQAGFNMRQFPDGLGLSFDETTTEADIEDILKVFGGSPNVPELLAGADLSYPSKLARSSPFLTNPVFNSHHSEMAMQRYIFKLADKDISLTRSMVPLGSCTMKLNATCEMIPITWPEFGRMHPFAPVDQCQGYQEMITELSSDLCDITGFQGITLQPNSGAQGEFAGLLAIRQYHIANGDADRKICLIPSSAHGTNPASASMCGMKVVVVKSAHNGDVDLDDLKDKVEKHSANLGALMITYPSTHGVYENSIVDVCKLIHQHGGQVYMDGANMNAQVGYASPGEIGADVCHLNLHKTFCIPHGGGGPGVGPIGVASHLIPFLPSHPEIACGGEHMGPVSAAPWGSASILPITYMYLKGMGSEGLKKGTAVAVLNANYMAHQLQSSFPILYQGDQGRNAHEFILNINPLKTKTGISEKDIAKRLMDYGFHAPTMSWPAVGTLMVEPTESEYKAEMDRYIEALVAIRQEIKDVEDGVMAADNNPLVNSPHSLNKIVQEEWDHPYSREQAAFPLPWVKAAKFWPHGRVNDEFGDRNLVCSCPPMESYEDLELEVAQPKSRLREKA